MNEIVICLPIIQEVLQGFDDDYTFEQARESLYTFRVIENPLKAELFDEAISIFVLRGTRASRFAHRSIASSPPVRFATTSQFSTETAISIN